MSRFEIVAHGDGSELFRPCADCGRITGSFCDFCLGRERFPQERWSDHQHTPLCSFCDDEHGACHFCREEQSSSDSEAHPAAGTRSSGGSGPDPSARGPPALQPGDLDSAGRVAFGPPVPPGLIDSLRAEEQKLR